ncbi:hypothetical protein TNCV_1775601 [Trichonephila clavipes]|nr:hypothetical protein TNCV_1775601 [Trichonephila clavipes]
MKTSSEEFISRSPNPLPMKSEHRRFVLLGKFLSLGSGSEGKREIVLNRHSPLVSMEVPLRTAYGQNGRCGMQPKAKHSLRAQAQLMRTETVETVELVKVKQKLGRERRENARGARAGVTF